jgi:hypothetical protein
MVAVVETRSSQSAMNVDAHLLRLAHSKERKTATSYMSIQMKIDLCLATRVKFGVLTFRVKIQDLALIGCA